ncbi:MAG: hypothetical protein MRY83_09860 [Flavobacteriales bacterium]|nr:hypothetical protein [Flavobacteriales bacterium]
MKTIDLKHIQWLDFSGSPVIFIPESLKGTWMGFFNTQPDDDAIDRTPDLTIDDQDYFVSTDFDFDKPKTHYDELCGQFEREKAEVIKFKVEKKQLLAISSFFDPIGWDTKQNIFFNGKLNELDLAYSKKLDWQTTVEWLNPDNKVYMMNACCTLFEEDLVGEMLEIDLPAGRYLIEEAYYEHHYCSYLYRFRLLNK